MLTFTKILETKIKDLQVSIEDLKESERIIQQRYNDLLYKEDQGNNDKVSIQHDEYCNRIGIGNSKRNRRVTSKTI